MIAKLAKETDTIVGVVRVIKGMSEHTNLLALEAPRAGGQAEILRWLPTKLEHLPTVQKCHY